MSGLFSFCKDLFSSTKKRTFSSRDECTESNETEEDRSNKKQTEEDENRSADHFIRGNSYERSSVVELLLYDALRYGNEEKIMFFTNILRQLNESKYKKTNILCNAITYRYTGKVAAPNPPVVEEVEDDLIFNKPVQDEDEPQPQPENAPQEEDEPHPGIAVNRRSSG